MKFLSALVLALVLSFSAHAQSTTPPAAPPTQIFTFSGNLSGFSGATATNGAVIATAAIQVTNQVSAGYEHIAISGINSRFELGVIGYTRTLNALLGPTLSNKLLFDPSQIGVTFTAGAGKVLEPTANRIAETVGVHISYPLTNNMSVQVIGVDFLHGGGNTGFITSNFAQAVSTGLNIHF
jgi:hypothetical protein